MKDEKTNSIKLKSCPFCGGKNIDVFKYTPYGIEKHRAVCLGCGCTITRNTEEEVTEIWNTRK